MEGPHATTRGGASLSSAPLKPSAISRAKATADTRKRKRGALQDISNSSRLSSSSAVTAAAKKAASVGGVIKPTKPALAAVARGVARQAPTASRSKAAPTNTTTGSNPVPTKRRRQEENQPDQVVHGKRQTSLLSSFKSIAPVKVIKKEKEAEPTDEEPVIKEEPPTQEESAVVIKDEPDMECTEALVKQEEPVVPVKRKPSVVPSTSSTHPPITPYVPPQYKFTFNHRDSGFDEETYSENVCDIDAEFCGSAVHCVNLIHDMDRYHRQHETKYHTEPNYIGSVQMDINEKMRGILVDWLVEVGEEYELDSKTFHKAVNLVDRCLAKMKINRKQFQLLGCACMMIAAKYEEVYAPNIEEFVYISDQTYTPEEMLEMEIKVLDTLEYRIGSTTCHGFLPRFTRAGCLSDKQKALVEYLCDFAILEYSMLQFRPSQVAASAVYLSRVMTGEAEPWTPTLHHYSKYNAWDLEPCVMALYKLHRVENEVVQAHRDKAKAVSEKYFAEKFHAVSALPSIHQAVLEESFLAYDKPSYLIKSKSKSPEAEEEEESQ